MEDWKPEWGEVGDAEEVHFSGGGPGGFGRETEVQLLCCQTEDGNWLYLAVTPQGGVALAIEYVKEER